jgi:arsenate reductase-like glutaredoxin family protein
MYFKSKGSTCRKAGSFLLAKGAELEERDLGKHPLRVEELEALDGDRNYGDFPAPKNIL